MSTDDSDQQAPFWRRLPPLPPLPTVRVPVATVIATIAVAGSMVMCHSSQARLERIARAAIAQYSIQHPGVVFVTVPDGQCPLTRRVPDCSDTVQDTLEQECCEDLEAMEQDLADLICAKIALLCVVGELNGQPVYDLQCLAQCQREYDEKRRELDEHYAECLKGEA